MKARIAALLAGCWLSVAQDAAVRSPGFSSPRISEDNWFEGVTPQSFMLAMEFSGIATVIVDQREADLSVVVFAPDGSQAGLWDGFERGIEPVSVSSQQFGAYRVEVRPRAGRGSFKFAIRLGPVHSSTPEDRLRIEAETLASAAKGAYAEGTRESRLKALDNRIRSAELWDMLREPRAAALSRAAAADTLYKLSRFEEAILRYQVAIGTFRTLGDRRGEAETLNNLGLSHWQTGQLTTAAELFSAALLVWGELHHEYGEAATLTNRGLMEWESGRFSEALADHRRAAQLFKKLRSSAGEGLALNNAGVALEAIGDFGRAQQNLESAIRLLRSARDRSGEGRAWLRLGRIRLRTGNAAAALAASTRAQPLIQASGDRVAEAELFQLIGDVHSKQRHGATAVSFYQQSKKLFEDAGREHGAVEVLIRLGTEWNAAGHSDRARSAFREAAARCHRSGFPRAEMDALHLLANTERRARNPEQARPQIEAAVEIAERLRQQVPPGNLRVSYFGGKQSLFQDYIELLLELYRRNGDPQLAGLAFDAGERMRARNLLETLGTTGASLRSPEVLRKQRELQSQINFWYLRMERAAGGELEILRRKFEAALADYGDLSAERPVAGAPRTPAQTLLATLPDVQREALDDDTLLLSFLPGESRGYLWAVTRTSWAVFDLPGEERLEAAGRKLRESVSAVPASPSDTRYLAPARELARLLLGPASGRLSGKKLVVAATGWLQTVPFALLPDPESGTPLMIGHEISMVPSASALIALRRKARQRPLPAKSLAFVADAVYAGDDPRIKERLTSASSKSFPRLAYSGLAANAVLAKAPRDATLYSGFRANRALFTDGQLRDYRILHFATHSIVDPVYAPMSSLVFSLFNEKGSPQDGFLRAGEVAELGLTPELMVLDACHSGLGRVVPGEGIAGLASSFLASGATRVAASLWEVDDGASAQLMQTFYAKLFGPGHESPASALRTAQLAMASAGRFRHPYYWAGFVLYGEYH